MALNPTANASTNNWNYTKPDEPGFALKLVGTVAAIQEVQAMNFGANGLPSTPKFWDDGNPVMNIRMVLVGPSGGYRTWTFAPASKAAREGKRKSVHIDLFNLAGGKDILQLIGKTISIETIAPPAGFNYGIGNPRPWTVALVEDQGPYELAEPLDPIFTMPKVLANQAVSGGQVQAPPMQAPVAAPMQAPAQAPAPTAAPAAQTDPYADDIPF
ncbi:hypothetical protein [uncultured Halomonas sp.]|uniref:hypothetical protein n=1 Tax=uncultured Halomonas sp. TaxID=173971 RepID=UPI0026092C73|nr:hypothetical protein [uncultured Halomonas sp.]